MTREEAIKRITNIVENEDDITGAFELACTYGVEMCEIWSDDEEEIIGMMVEDEVIYY